MSRNIPTRHENSSDYTGSQHDNSRSTKSAVDDTLSGKEGRDEIVEVEKMARRDTVRVRKWRFAVTGMLILSAVIFTWGTLRALRNEEKKNFETAYDQFARSVGQAAVDQQEDIREGLRSLANMITASTQSNNFQWPFVTMPFFESYASNILSQSQAEFCGFFPLVKEEEVDAWINYSNASYEEATKEAHMIHRGNLDRLTPVGFHPFITKATPEGIQPDHSRSRYFPLWGWSPPPASYGLINLNLASQQDYEYAVEALYELNNETTSTWVRPYTAAVSTAFTKEEHDAMHSKLRDSTSEYPHTVTFYPIHKTLKDDSSDIVGIVGFGVAWDASLRFLLPSTIEGLHAVIRNDCNQSYTYELIGSDAVFVGIGDLHDPQYDDFEAIVQLFLDTHRNIAATTGHCKYFMHIYPSDRFKAIYTSKMPVIFAVVVAMAFLIVTVLFFVYDKFVQLKNEKLIFNAARSNAIVASLFPDSIRDRLIGQTAEVKENLKGRQTLRNFLSDRSEENPGVDNLSSKPLADLFLDTTVLYADIVGFTAWSSVREPSQVFSLLETLFSSFDEACNLRNVYKVETVGDCYVAATGLQDYSSDHAVAMVLFAKDIIGIMNVTTESLEVTLGPGTGELELRIGIHSGPVTAGVLRGDRSRFQLFGDTMNTCLLIEHTSHPNQIQVSQETADMVIDSGNGHWLIKRKNPVTGKGKNLTTYWVDLNAVDNNSMSIDKVSECALCEPSELGTNRQLVENSERGDRLIDWNVEILVGLLRQIVARRIAQKGKQSIRHLTPAEPKTRPLEEVQEIIALPEFDSKTARKQLDPSQVDLPGEVIEQLRNYVSCIAGLYRNNPFHNFAHASHVLMSVTKLMSRIVAPEGVELEGGDNGNKNGRKGESFNAACLHDHTYGITSDPLTQFACAFSALIHDVDHTGVSNAQLMKENPELAELYVSRSVAEQNSLDIAWKLLMQEKYSSLRASLYSDKAERSRFRHLVVNSVMATDIFDKDLKALRNSRWEKAFKDDSEKDESPRDALNRKATIVIEHLIQASDVSHTMQHWHVFRKWNENLFEEMYNAYRDGRSDNNPSEFWYKSEIGFFDFYIIPLTKKLKECGVFGVSSGEYLDYAIKNRQEWESVGQDLVVKMTENARKKYGLKTP